MNKTPYSIGYKGNNYLLITPHGNVKIDNKKTGLDAVFDLVEKNEISGVLALKLATEIITLPIRLFKDYPWMKFSESPHIYRKEGWDSYTGILNRRIAIEKSKDKYPSLFACDGCGEHAYIVGKNFIYYNTIQNKSHALAGILSIYESGFISRDEGHLLTFQADHLSLNPPLTTQGLAGGIIV